MIVKNVYESKNPGGFSAAGKRRAKPGAVLSRCGSGAFHL